MTVRRLLATVISAVLLLAPACGDDDDAGGDTTTTEGAESTTTSEALSADAAAFCDALEPLQEFDTDAVPTPEDIEAVRSAGEAAPDQELADATGVIADLGQQVADADQSDPEALQEVNEEARAPEVVDAAGSLASFTSEECGFDVPLFAQLGADFGAGQNGGGGEEESGEDEVDTGAVREDLAASAPEVDDQLIGISDIDGTYVATVVGVSEDDAVEVCDAISSSFVSVGSEGVTLQVADEEATVYAEGETGSDCEAA